MTQSDGRTLPLFYRRPEPLSAASHGDLRLIAGDYDFARETNATPLAAIEFATAMRDYPIVFSEDDGFPLAILGLERENRFIAEDGTWAENAYIPAYVRRYPFVFAEARADSFALAADLGSDRLVRGGEAGEALFADGKPTPPTEGAMAFCREFHGAHLQTRAFVEALRAADLMVPQHADATLGSGRPLKLSGFTVVDRTRFEALPDDIVIAWHRKGWMALIHFHFVSLDRFADLLDRETRFGDVATMSQSAATAQPAPQAAEFEQEG